MLVSRSIAILVSFLCIVPVSPLLADGVYGIDDREETYLSSLKAQELARSIGGMISLENLKKLNERNLSILEMTLSTTEELCLDVRFGEQPSLTSCTGFLIAPNKVLTAGHCVEMNRNPCKDFSWVFDYKLDASGNYLSEMEVVACKRIVHSVFNPLKNQDYAIIELERTLERPVLKPYKEKVHVGDVLMSIGHPNGIPQKVASFGEVLNLEKDFFGFNIKKITHNLDLFRGNSGSPIIHAQSGRFIGVAMLGELDYYETENKCMDIERYSENSSVAEIATSIDSIQEL